MTATVIIERLTGAGPSRTDLAGGNTRANAADAHTTGDTASPIEIPSGSPNYSYWVSTQLNATVAPDNLLDNIEWFTDSSNSYGTGITNLVGVAASYTQATGTPAVTGTELLVGVYSGLSPSPPEDAFAETTGSPLTVAGNTTGTGAFGSIVVYQVVVASSASAGTKPATPETFSWRFDET